MSLYIAAWRSLATATEKGETVNIASGHPVFEGVVAVSGATAQSAIVTTGVGSPAAFYVRLRADEACHVAIGLNPTATTTNALKLGAGESEWVSVPNGQRIAVIAGV